jgi:hypothetical protein
MAVALAKDSIDLGIMVQDIKTALPFYKDLLGFEVRRPALVYCVNYLTAIRLCVCHLLCSCRPATPTRSSALTHRFVCGCFCALPGSVHAQYDSIGPMDMGERGVMHRLLCGTSLIKVRQIPAAAAGSVAALGGINGATGMRYWTISISNMDAIVGKCNAAGYAIPMGPLEFRPVRFHSRTPPARHSVLRQPAHLVNMTVCDGCRYSAVVSLLSALLIGRANHDGRRPRRQLAGAR